MVWHIRGTRILSDKEASAEDTLSAFENSWLGAASAGFLIGLLPFWWATGDFGIGVLAGIVVGILNVPWPIVGVSCSCFLGGVAIWKLVPPYWNWGAYLVLAILMWKYIISDKIYMWRLRHEPKK